MKAALRFLTCLAVVLTALVVGAQQDEQPGTTVVYNLDNSFCGITGGTLHGFPIVNCHSILFSLPGQPAGSAGSIWVDTNTMYANPPGAFIQTGFSIFSGSTDLTGAQATVTSSTLVALSSPMVSFKGFPPGPPYVCNNNCSTFTANISGTTPDDGGTYTAVLKATLFYYVAGGSGKGGGGYGTHVIVLKSQPGDGTGLAVTYH